MPATARLAISGIEVAAAIYDTLTAPNTKGEIKPYLAKSVTPNADFTQWTITLRDGVKFHDGTPVDAASVAANIDAYRKNVLVGQALQNIASVTVTSPTVVTVATTTTWPEFGWYLYLDGRMGIVAPKQLNGSDEDCASDLVGSGPFKLAEPWIVNQKLVAAKNADYWQKDAKGVQLPYLNQITFVPTPEAVQRVNGLQGGSLDVIHTSDGQQVDQLNQLKSSLTLLQEKPGRREVRNYLMNTAPDKPVAGNPLADLNARKAVAMAIDRNQVNELRNNGVFQVANGPFDSSVMGYLKNPGFPKYNPTEAKKLVTAYKAAHDGQFSVVLEHTDDPANTEEAALLKQQLAKVGIDSTLKGEDQTAFILSAVTGNYSILLWRNYPGDDPDVNYQWWQNGSLLNFNDFIDNDMQALLDQGRVSTDVKTRDAGLPGDQQALRGAGLQRVGVLLGMDHRGEQEGPGPRRSAPSRRRWSTGVPLRPPPAARDLGVVVTRHAGRATSILVDRHRNGSDRTPARAARRRRHLVNAVRVQLAPVVPGRRRRRGRAVRHPRAEAAVPRRQRPRQAVLRAVRDVAEQPRPR